MTQKTDFDVDCNLRSIFADSNTNNDSNNDSKKDNVFFPENFGCLISGPSDCGKTHHLKNLLINKRYFEILFIIGPACDQN